MPTWKKIMLEGGSFSLDSLSDWATGTDEPDSGNFQTLMPSVGSIYHRTGTSQLEFYVREENARVSKWYGTTSSYFKYDYDWGDFAPESPEATDINFTDTSNGNSSNVPSTKLLGSTQSVYAKAIYNGEITLPFDNDEYPTASFTGANFGSRSMSGGDGAYTISSVTISGSSDGGTSTVSWSDNGVQEGSVDVIDEAGSDTVTWRNNRIAGTYSGGVPTNAQISDSGGAQYQSLASSGGTTYNNFSTTLTVSAGEKIFFGFPTSYSASSCMISGEEQIGGFGTTTKTYTNSEGYTQSYKIYYSNNPQAAGDIGISVTG